MQPAHSPAVVVVVVTDVVVAAAAMPKSSTEGLTEEPTKKPRADSVGAAEVDCHGLTSPCTTTAVLASASATAEIVGSYRIDVGADQVVLPSSSHSRFGFSPSKEAKASVVRGR